MTPREIVLAQIHHRETRPVPYTIDFEGGVDEELDAYYGSPDWRKRLTSYMVRVGGVNTIGHEPMDDIRFRDAFGGVWRLDKRPWHLETPPLAEPSFDDYTFPRSEDFDGGPTEDAQESLAKGDRFSTVGIGWGLFEQAWRIRGFANALMDVVAEPDFHAELLDRLTDLYLSHVERFAALPADAVKFGDDWGDQRGVIIGPERWRKFLKPRWARIYDAVHAQGKLVITHCCGSIADVMPDLIEIGLDVLESVQPEAAGMTPYELKKKWGDKLAFWGCLGTQSTLQFGTPQEIRDEVNRLCREMGKGGGYILHPAKPLQPGTPVETAPACVEAFVNQEF